MRHKNFDLVAAIIWSVVSVVIIGILIYQLIYYVNSTTDVAREVIKNTEDIADGIAEYSLMKYDGQEVKGSQVRNFIKEQLGDYDTGETAPIYVQVTTAVSGTAYTNSYENKQYFDDMKSFASTRYFIKPEALFRGEVIRTDNKAIMGIQFVQQ